MYLKLQRTDRVRHTLEIIALTVCEIVHRIYLPFRTRTVVRVTRDDTVHDRVTEMHVRVRHFNLRTQHHLAFLYLSALHRFEKTQVLFDRTVAVRRCHTGLRRRTFLFGYLLRALLVHVRLALFDEHDSQIV